MFYVIILLIVFSIILLSMEYQNRYSWLFFMMTTGMALAFFSISVHLAKFSNYYYSFNILFQLDYTIFAYVSRTIKLPLSTIARMMNLGIALYLLAVPLFIYDFTQNKNRRITRILILFTLIIYNLWFYDPRNAYLAYISYNTTPPSALYRNHIYILHQFNRIWILVYLFYPVGMLRNYMAKNTIPFIKRQIFLLAICLCVMNLLFYSVFFMGPFMMSPFNVFTTGFWIFENIQLVFYRYYLIIPLSTACVLLFTLLLLLNYRLGSFVHVFTDRKIQQNISRMNDLLSDTLHSQKNLLFSIHILAKQAVQNKDNPEERQENTEKILELSELSLKRTSEMLDSLRDIRYKFQDNDLLSALEEAIKKVNPPPHIRVVWSKNKFEDRDRICNFDFFHISQVFVNILNNGIEAINLAGREEGIIQIDIAVQFQWIFIIIQDNGTGIKKQFLKKIFDPYFSNKPAISNWGLGLSYAYKVIKSHLGILRIESKYGESTTIQIMLPSLQRKGGQYVKDTDINRGRLRGNPKLLSGNDPA
ncbi:hypothetical protein FACS1894130_06440 [Spirochaetia bacterium]|nr:hypothetical protein FACS1894130_06440 [Spirochaetia bacterium]